MGRRIEPVAVHVFTLEGILTTHTFPKNHQKWPPAQDSSTATPETMASGKIALQNMAELPTATTFNFSTPTVSTPTGSTPDGDLLTCFCTILGAKDGYFILALSRKQCEAEIRSFSSAKVTQQIFPHENEKLFVLHAAYNPEVFDCVAFDIGMFFKVLLKQRKGKWSISRVNLLGKSGGIKTLLKSYV